MYPTRMHVHHELDRYAEGMMSLSAALETEDIRLQSLALETYGSFLYLTGDMDGSLDMFRCIFEIFRFNTTVFNCCSCYRVMLTVSSKRHLSVRF